jgi:hypothetical protein
MPFFVKSHFQGECDQCGISFDPRKGGVCSVCKDAVCGRHLYASAIDKLKVYFGSPMVCLKCRAVRG